MSEGKRNNSVFALALAGVASLGCLGVGVAISTVLMLWMFMGGGGTAGQQDPEQFSQLRITPPGGATALAPLPKRLPADGPKLPNKVIDTDQCSDLEDGGKPKDSCITQEISCDEMVIGHTVGGVERFDSTFYEKKFCWPRTMDHDSGDERVYKLTMPPGEWRAFVTLHTPCADLTMAAMRHDRPTCPTMRDPVRQCEMRPKDNLNSENLELVSQTDSGRNAIWYLVVEGRDDEEGPFSLHVQCAPGLGGPI